MMEEELRVVQREMGREGVGIVVEDEDGSLIESKVRNECISVEVVDSDSKTVDAGAGAANIITAEILFTSFEFSRRFLGGIIRAAAAR